MYVIPVNGPVLHIFVFSLSCDSSLHSDWPSHLQAIPFHTFFYQLSLLLFLSRWPCSSSFIFASNSNKPAFSPSSRPLPPASLPPAIKPLFPFSSTLFNHPGFLPILLTCYFFLICCCCFCFCCLKHWNIPYGLNQQEPREVTPHLFLTNHLDSASYIEIVKRHNEW